MNPVIEYKDGVFTVSSEILSPRILVSLLIYIYTAKVKVANKEEKQLQINAFRYKSANGEDYPADWIIDIAEELIPENFSNQVNPYFGIQFKVSDLLSPDNLLSDTNPIFDNSLFKIFFKFRDTEVLAWAFNILEKIYAKGELAFYVNRTNIDFSSFWLSVSHLFGMIVMYGREYTHLSKNDVLFNEFLTQRGLITTTVNSAEAKEYLYANYVEEYRKRGTYRIIEKGEIINGELLRLIGFEDINEFIFAPLAPQDTGWCIGHSSPTWQQTVTIKNVDKAKSNKLFYNLIGTTDNWGEGQKSNYLTLTPTIDGSGIGLPPTGDYQIYKDKLFRLNVFTNYEIAFRFRIKIEDKDKIQNLGFGVDVLDNEFNKIQCILVSNNQDSEDFYDITRVIPPDEKIKYPNDKSFMLPQMRNGYIENGYMYFGVRGMIYALNQIGVNSELNFRNGISLRWNSRASYFTPKIVQYSGGDVAEVQLFDISVKPEKMYFRNTLSSKENWDKIQGRKAKDDRIEFEDIRWTFSQGYFGSKNIIWNYVVNNSEYSYDELKDFIERYLVCYKNIEVLNILPKNGKEIPFATVQPKDILLPKTGDAQTVTVTSNTSWTVS